MKKALLACSLALVSWFSHGQVATYVLQPASIAGSLDFSLAEGWGLSPDMNDPANLVQAYAVIVDDGSTADSLGCDPLINAPDVAGKIAVVYRGVCEFGLKALNAQNAGAVAVVIVNNIPGAPVGMAGGTNGASVTIPVVMISQDGGALIHDEVVAGNVEMLIGTVQNLFPNNLALIKAGTMIPAQAARPALISTDENEFNVILGAWLFNYGSVEQAGATLQASVVHNGTTVYDETSAPATVPSGDSVYFSLPDFAQAGYDGRYEITYTAHLTEVDQFPDDNTYSTTLTVDTMLSYSPLTTDGLPEQIAFFRPADASQVFQICAYFADPNASRLRVEGVYAAATLNAPATVVGQLLDVRLFEWNDDFTGLSDATFNDVSEIMNGQYQYTDSALARVPVYIPFFEPTPLLDDQKYLFCVSTSDEGVFLGHTSSVNYRQNEELTDQVNTLLNIDGSWSRGWSTGEVPALGIKMVGLYTGIHEPGLVELTAYPNPASTKLSIPLSGQTGTASVQVFDSKGAMVSDKQVNVGGDNILTMDVRDLNAGMYMFHVAFDKGARSSFRVVVTK
ncbi:MAG: T9SS type A sorting domain-containing protein [Flavobacteriales bacterium]|jgi:hypothetical protein|nr:T9SS type A sorting domain-containing protein [Flavobacteriales bacterium]MCB0758797.1 T9SS type A sorting domain-containing protein [Flavobacteriales bacterium]